MGYLQRPHLVVLILVITLCAGSPICRAQSPTPSQESIGAAPVSGLRIGMDGSPMLLAESVATDTNMTSLAIPDYAVGVPGYASLVIDMMCAPQGARVSRVSLSARVEHAYVGDLVLKLTNAENTELLLWNRQGDATDAGLDDDIQTDADVLFSDRNIEGIFDGAVVNQSWALEAYDHASGNTGNTRQHATVALLCLW